MDINKALWKQWQPWEPKKYRGGGEKLTPRLNGRKLGSSGRAKETRHRVTEAQERERTAWRD